MAILRAFYLEGLRAILVRAYRDGGFLAVAPLIRAGVEWTKDGGTAGERADRREALRAMLTALQETNGGTFDRHVLRHVLHASGVAPSDLEDVPRTTEPQV